MRESLMYGSVGGEVTRVPIATIACSSSSCIAGFRQTSRPWLEAFPWNEIPRYPSCDWDGTFVLLSRVAVVTARSQFPRPAGSATSSFSPSLH
jgi:hypothetical protein